MTVLTRRQVGHDRDVRNRVLILRSRLTQINSDLIRIGLPKEERQKLEEERRDINRSMTMIRENCNHNLTHDDDRLTVCSICYEIL